MEKKINILRTAGFMVIATVMAKVLGMLRDIFLAANYGTGMEAVAFDVASRIPILLFDFVIGGVVTSSFIPIFNVTMQNDGKEKAMKFANNYVNLILLITATITVIGIAFAGPLISVMAPDIPIDTKALAINLSNIMFPMIIFTGLAFSFVGILQSLGEFNLPSIISLISNLIMITYFFTFNSKFGIKGLAVAMLIGWGAQAVIQIPKLRKLGYKYRPTLNLSDNKIKQSLKLAVPMLVSTWVQPLCMLINTRFASGIENGRAITALRYANSLYIIVVGIFSFVASNLLFPYLSRANAAGKKDEGKKLTITSLKALTLIIIPIMAGFMLLATNIISLIYERQAFTASDVALTSTALTYYSIGMIGMAFNEILNKSFFSLQDSKTPMITSVISMVFNMIFAVTLSKLMGIGGIALASGLAAIINAILNYIFMQKKSGKLFDKNDVIDLAKILISVVLMSIGVYFVNKLNLNKILSVIIPTATGVIIYFLSATVLKITEVRMIFNMIKKRGEDKK